MKPKHSEPATALTTLRGELRVQASLDHVADSMGGREVFLDACLQSDAEKPRQFLAAWRSLSTTERDAISLQDLCARSEINVTELVGSMMGSLVMQSNNVALLKAAIARPQLMDYSIANAMSDSDTSYDERKLHFQMAGFIKGEGTQVVNLTQNVQGTGVLSFEDDSHQSTASVRAEGKPVVVQSTEPTPFDADGELVPDVLAKGN